MMPSHNAIVRSPKPHPRGPTAHSPARRTPVTTRSESSTTRSARAPAASTGDGSPSAPAEFTDYCRTASSKASSWGRWLWATANRNNRSMVAVLPAMVCVPASRATPSTTSTASGPIR